MSNGSTTEQLVAHTSRVPVTIELADRDVMMFFQDRAYQTVTGISISGGQSSKSYSGGSVAEGDRSLFYARTSRGDLSSPVRYVPYVDSADLEGGSLLPFREVMFPDVTYNKESNLLTMVFWTNFISEVTEYDVNELLFIDENTFSLDGLVVYRALCFSVGSLEWKSVSGGSYDTSGSENDLVPIFTKPQIIELMPISNKTPVEGGELEPPLIPVVDFIWPDASGGGGTCEKLQAHVIVTAESGLVGQNTVTLPNGIQYVLDADGNGSGLNVFRNGLLQTVGNYEETSTTSVTFEYTDGGVEVDGPVFSLGEVIGFELLRWDCTTTFDIPLQVRYKISAGIAVGALGFNIKFQVTLPEALKYLLDTNGYYLCIWYNGQLLMKDNDYTEVDNQTVEILAGRVLPDKFLVFEVHKSSSDLYPIKATSSLFVPAGAPAPIGQLNLPNNPATALPYTYKPDGSGNSLYLDVYFNGIKLIPGEDFINIMGPPANDTAIDVINDGFRRLNGGTTYDVTWIIRVP